ncbi:MAG: PASTA domain-containing protein [Bacteroidaceae bacterium]|nr:PASTA domain-containing protein [Bacteroidaceae bacterium]
MKKNNKNQSGFKRGVKLTVINLLAMLVITVVILVVTFSWLDSYTRHNEAYKVPDVKGLQLSDAIEELKNQKLDYAVQEYKYKAGASDGEVLEQMPLPDALVKEGRKIYLVLNTTEAPKQGVPPVIDNCSLREAQFRLKAAGFIVEKVDVIEGEREWVYGVRYEGIELENGAAIPRGSKLTLVVGSGDLLESDTVRVDAEFF